MLSKPVTLEDGRNVAGENPLSVLPASKAGLAF